MRHLTQQWRATGLHKQARERGTYRDPLSGAVVRPGLAEAMAVWRSGFAKSHRMRQHIEGTPITEHDTLPHGALAMRWAACAEVIDAALDVAPMGAGWRYHGHYRNEGPVALGRTYDFRATAVAHEWDGAYQYSRLGRRPDAVLLRIYDVRHLSFMDTPGLYRGPSPEGIVRGRVTVVDVTPPPVEVGREGLPNWARLLNYGIERVTCPLARAVA